MAMHVTRRGMPALLGAALLAAALAGCGGSSGGSATTSAAAAGTNASAAAPATTSTAATTSTPTTTSTPATTSASATTSATAASSTGGSSTGGSAKTAAPGTALATGQPATVSFQTTTNSGGNGPTYHLQVTVVSIKKGSLKDFNGIQLNASEKASTPYYAEVKIANIGGTSFNTSSNDPAVSVQGVDDTGNAQDSVTFFGTFPPCNDVDTPNPLKAGQSFQTCLTYLVPGGITKVAYTGTDAYDTSPVTWAVK